MKRILATIFIFLLITSVVFAATKQYVTQTLTYAASKTIVATAHGDNVYFMTATGNCAFTLIGGTSGDTATFFITCDATPRVMTFGTGFTSGGTMTLNASLINVIRFTYTGSTWKEEYRMYGNTAGGSIGGGLPSASQGDSLYASATDTWTTLSKNTTATRYLSNTGTNNNPAWAQVNLTNGVTGALPVANGGTNKSSWTQYSIPYASASTTIAEIAPAANSILVTNGSNVPSLATDIPTAVTIGGSAIYRAGGTDVAVADGGTGASDNTTARTNLGLGSIAVLDSPLPTANGGSPATDIIEIDPATLKPSPDGAANSCTLTVGYDRTNCRGYIEFNSGSATQDYDGEKEIKLPPNFSSFAASALSVDIYTVDYATSVATVTVYKNDNSVDVNATSVITNADTTWQTKTAAPATSGYTAGDNVKILIHIGTGNAASEYVRIGRIFLTYNTR